LPEHLRGFVTFAYKSGWRYSEITALEWPQVDRQQRIVRLEVGTTKNKEARIFYLDEELTEVFNTQFAGLRLGCPYVFHEQGEKIKEITSVWRKACKEGKVGKKLFHDFRRTAVRNMVSAGIPERVAMTISGHKTRSVFDRYNIVNPDDLKQASGKMEAYLRSQDHGHNLGTIRESSNNTLANGVVQDFSLSKNSSS